MRFRTRIVLLGIALASVGAIAGRSRAAGIIDARAIITAAADGPNFDYTVTLTNTSGAGNDAIGAFWLAWIPGEDFMATSPLSVTNPAGWKDAITHFPNVPTNGVAIQWEELSAANALAPGDSLVFRFTSADSPAALMGDSIFYPGTPVLTSFVYSGVFPNGDPKQILATFASVPEPSSLTLGLVATMGAFAGYRLRRKRAPRPAAPGRA